MSAETPLRHTNEDDALARALHAAYDDGPSEAELRALEAGVLGAIQGGGGGGGGAPPALPKTSLWMPLASVASVGAIVATIAVGARFMASEEAPETPSVRVSLEAPHESITTLEVPPIPHGVEPPAEVTVEPSRVRRPRVEEPARPVEEVPAASAPEVEPEDEMLLLRRATSSLQARPEEALTLTERMARVPHPEWAEERERVAIEALVRLSRRSEAEARFARFSQAYPRSAYATRLRDVLSEAQ